MLIRGMYGFGDSIYQRAFLREYSEDVYLRTAWPQLYCDLPHVLPVRPATHLRTQMKNVRKQDASIWHDAPLGLGSKRIQYHAGAFSLRHNSILKAMEHHFGVTPRIFDLPDYGVHDASEPYVVVRPSTIRLEWCNPARNPGDGYIREAAAIARDYGFKILSIADLVDGVEWADELPVCDYDYTHGELDMEDLVELVRGASLVIGGVGWIVPAAIATGTPLIVILGGQGGYNAPEKITAPPMDVSRTRWIYPDTFSMSFGKRDRCDKTITNFKYQFESAMGELCLIP